MRFEVHMAVIMNPGHEVACKLVDECQHVKGNLEPISYLSILKVEQHLTPNVAACVPSCTASCLMLC